MNSFEDKTLAKFQAMVFNGQQYYQQPFTVPNAIVETTQQSICAANGAKPTAGQMVSETTAVGASTPTQDGDPNPIFWFHLLRYLMEAELKQQQAQCTVSQEQTNYIQGLFQQHQDLQQQLTAPMSTLNSWPTSYSDGDAQANMDTGTLGLNTNGSISPQPINLPQIHNSPCSSNTSFSFTSAPRSPDSYSSQTTQDGNIHNVSFGAVMSSPASPVLTPPLPLSLSIPNTSLNPQAVCIPPLPPAISTPIGSQSGTAAIPLSSQSCGSSSSASSVSCSAGCGSGSSSATTTSMFSAASHPSWRSMIASQRATTSHNRAAAKALLKSPPQTQQAKHKRTVSDGASPSHLPARNSAALLLLHRRVKQDHGDALADVKSAKRSKYSPR